MITKRFPLIIKNKKNTVLTNIQILFLNYNQMTSLFKQSSLMIFTDRIVKDIGITSMSVRIMKSLHLIILLLSSLNLSTQLKANHFTIDTFSHFHDIKFSHIVSLFLTLTLSPNRSPPRDAPSTASSRPVWTTPDILSS